MVILLLSIILIGLAIIDKVVHSKKSRNWNIVRLCIRLLIISSLFLIAYYVTDTISGLLYVFFSICGYLIISVINNRSIKIWINNLVIILGFPLLTCLFFNAFHNTLISFSAIMLPIILTGVVLSYPYEYKFNVSKIISIIVGIGIAIVLVFFYYKTTDVDTRKMYKQEIIAQDFLEEELGLKKFRIHTERKLRGEDTRIRAYNSSGTSVTMIYKNNKIISYHIEN